MSGISPPRCLGSTVWITDSTGREEKTRIVGLTGGNVATATASGTRHLPTTDVKRVRMRRADTLIDGALIGAGVAVASGLLLCSAMEPWENCRDEVGPMLRFGAVGAGIGIGIDALIRGRKTIYEALPPVRRRAVPDCTDMARGPRYSASRIAPRPEAIEGNPSCIKEFVFLLLQRCSHSRHWV